MRFFKKCKHLWYVTTTGYDSDMHDSWEVVHMYCPVCDKSQTVRADVAERLMLEQAIRQQYEKAHVQDI